MCCVGCLAEDDGGLAGVELSVGYGAVCEEGGARVGASCDNVLDLIDLRNLLLYPRVLSAEKSVLMA